MKITVYIADDHIMFRDGIKAILDREKDIEVIGESGSMDTILKECIELKPNVILMDIDMGTSNGILTTEKLVNQLNDIKILAVSMHGESKYVTSMLEAGAHGYILKNSGREEVLSAVRTVNGGGTYMSRQVSSILLEQLNIGKKNNKDKIPITLREIEVLQLIAEEYSNSEIANKLFISIRTVDTHKRNLLEKIGVKNIAGLVKYAIKKGIISDI